MPLTDSDLEKLHALALTAATRAGAHIQSKVGAHRETNTKEGGDTPASQIVTEVDIEAQRLILETLRESIDTHRLGLLTEESDDDSSRLEAESFWCIDPLDGTLPFVEGTPGYSVSIALVSRKGEPQIGVIHDPTTDTTFHAQRGKEALKNGDPIPAPAHTTGGTLTWLMDRSMKNLDIFPSVMESMERLAAETGHSGLTLIDHAGAALNGAWVTQHAPAIYFKFPKVAAGGGSLWDFAASACLMTAWRQPCTDMHGQPLALNRAGSTFMNERGVLYASSAALANAVRQRYRRLHSSPS